jgi:hypothetical protein
VVSPFAVFDFAFADLLEPAPAFVDEPLLAVVLAGLSDSAGALLGPAAPVGGRWSAWLSTQRREEVGGGFEPMMVAEVRFLKRIC